MIHDRLEETVQMLGFTVIVVDECVKAMGEVYAQGRGVVPSHGLVAEMELVLIVVRETGELLVYSEQQGLLEGQ